MDIYSEFTHWKWWFSIVMLVYQRVYVEKKQHNGIVRGGAPDIP